MAYVNQIIAPVVSESCLSLQTFLSTEWLEINIGNYAGGVIVRVCVCGWEGVINGTARCSSCKIIPLDRHKNISNNVTSLNLPELQTSQMVLLLIRLLYRLATPVVRRCFICGPVSSQACCLDMQCPHLQAATHRGSQKRSNCFLSPVTCLVYTLSLTFWHLNLAFKF